MASRKHFVRPVGCRTLPPPSVVFKDFGFRVQGLGHSR